MWEVAERMITKQQIDEALKMRHGEVLQSKIAASQVAICGLGGLGSNIAIALARVGIGKLHLIDYDRVDLTNLNRQQYTISQLGCYKTEALSKTIKAIAPYCEIVIDTIKLTPANIPLLLSEDTIICEAFDKAEEKAMLAENVLVHLPNSYLIASSGMAGMSSTNTIKTRQVSSHFYLCGDETNGIDDGLGLMATRLLACAAHEAHMALRIIAGEMTP